MFTEAQVSQWQSDIYGLLDTPVPLAQWLRSQGSKVVGRGHHVNACPIHNFLVVLFRKGWRKMREAAFSVAITTYETLPHLSNLRL